MLSLIAILNGLQRLEGRLSVVLSVVYLVMSAGRCPASGVGRVAPRCLLVPRLWREVREALISAEGTPLLILKTIWLMSDTYSIYLRHLKYFIHRLTRLA